MTSNRPYRPALDVNVALKVLIGGAGTLYDSGVVDAFVKLRETGSIH
jgi:HD-GYP domain-containing protein (c-di-GMP phosphodiesterase class II)